MHVHMHMHGVHISQAELKKLLDAGLKKGGGGSSKGKGAKGDKVLSTGCTAYFTTKLAV